MIDLLTLNKRMKRIIPFQNFSEKDLFAIIRAGKIRKFPAGKTILFEGDPSSGLFVLFKGEVHLSVLSSEGQSNIISVIKPVIMFNELSVLDGGINPSTAVAGKDSIIWNTDLKSFQHGLEVYPELGISLLPIITRRYRELISKYSDLSFKPVRERLAALLLELSGNGGKVIQRKSYSIQYMASRIASNPVVISRTLGCFKEAGIIISERKYIEILDTQRLMEVSFLNLEIPCLE